MSFTPILRRIREDKTNYRKRKAILQYIEIVTVFTPCSYNPVYQVYTRVLNQSCLNGLSHHRVG